MNIPQPKEVTYPVNILEDGDQDVLVYLRSGGMTPDDDIVVLLSAIKTVTDTEGQRGCAVSIIYKESITREPYIFTSLFDHSFVINSLQTQYDEHDAFPDAVITLPGLIQQPISDPITGKLAVSWVDQEVTVPYRDITGIDRFSSPDLSSIRYYSEDTDKACSVKSTMAVVEIWAHIGFQQHQASLDNAKERIS